MVEDLESSTEYKLGQSCFCGHAHTYPNQSFFILKNAHIHITLENAHMRSSSSVMVLQGHMLND